MPYGYVVFNRDGRNQAVDRGSDRITALPSLPIDLGGVHECIPSERIAWVACVRNVRGVYPCHKPLPKKWGRLSIFLSRIVSARAMLTAAEYVFTPSTRVTFSRRSASNTRFVRFMCPVYLIEVQSLRPRP